MVKLGSLVSGAVDRITSNAVVIYVNAGGFSRGTISVEHLADHHGRTVDFHYMISHCSFLLMNLLIVAACYTGQATLMKSILKPGYKFDQLLVLGIVRNIACSHSISPSTSLMLKRNSSF